MLRQLRYALTKEIKEKRGNGPFPVRLRGVTRLLWLLAFLSSISLTIRLWFSHSGVLETIRIRREGYSARYTFQEFVDK